MYYKSIYGSDSSCFCCVNQFGTPNFISSLVVILESSCITGLHTDSNSMCLPIHRSGYHYKNFNGWMVEQASSLFRRCK